ITFTKSYTTRRSQPMIRSKLRRPTSKSITAVLKPRSANPVAMAALVVVIPTPPLPDATTTIFATDILLELDRGLLPLTATVILFPLLHQTKTCAPPCFATPRADHPPPGNGPQ